MGFSVKYKYIYILYIYHIYIYIYIYIISCVTSVFGFIQYCDDCRQDGGSHFDFTVIHTGP